MVNIIRLVIPLMWLRGKRGRIKHRSNISRDTPDLPPTQVVFPGHLELPAQRAIGPHYQRLLAALWLIVSSGQLISHSILILTARHSVFFFFWGASAVPERRVGGLEQGFVSEQGGAGRSHVVLQEGGNVFGGGAAEELQPLLQDLLPALQRFQHGVTQGRAHGQICGGGRGRGGTNTREQTKTQMD